MCGKRRDILAVLASSHAGSSWAFHSPGPAVPISASSACPSTNCPHPAHLMVPRSPTVKVVPPYSLHAIFHSLMPNPQDNPCMESRHCMIDTMRLSLEWAHCRISDIPCHVPCARIPSCMQGARKLPRRHRRFHRMHIQSCRTARIALVR